MRILALIVLLAAPALAGCVGQFLTGEVDLPAPDFELRDIDGGLHNLSAYEDRVLLIDMFGTWCGPCQRSIPFMHQMLDAYPDLAILSISGTDTEAEIEAFRQKYEVTWPLAAEPSVVRDFVRAGSGREGVLWPSYAIVHDGRMVFYNEGETLPATFAAAIEGTTDSPSFDAGTLVSSLPTALLAFLLGAAAWYSPFWVRDPRWNTGSASAATVRWALVGGVGLVALLAWFVGTANRFLTGRAYNVAAFVPLVTLVAFAWWRLREKRIAEEAKEAASADVIDEAPPEETIRPRRAAAILGNAVWYGSPAWFAVMLASMLSVEPFLGVVLQAAFGAGLMASMVAAWRVPAVRARIQAAGPAVAWLGVAGWAIGTGWTLWLRFL